MSKRTETALSVFNRPREESAFSYFLSWTLLASSRAFTSAGDQGSRARASVSRLAAYDTTAAAWEDAQQGITRLEAGQLLSATVENVLAQGFPGHDLRLFKGTPVRFECRCSQGRVAGLLRALGAEEVRSVLEEQGAVTVTCEFCHRPYRFDAADIDVLFEDASGSEAIH